MSRQWVGRSEGRVRRAAVTVLVASMVNFVVPAFAADGPSPATASTVSTIAVALPPISITDEASREVRAAFDRSISTEARRLALATQGSSTVEKSGHWCAGGLALLAGGVAAALISGVRRDYNAQKPSPPVGVVLGTGAAVVGGIETVRACRR
jgi:hypothetical protein